MSDNNQRKALTTNKPSHREYIFNRTLSGYTFEVSKSNNDVDSVEEIIPLSPRKDLSEDIHYQHYAKQLKSALFHEDIHNIALTGIYGSGKSSILATFKNQNKSGKNLQFVDISLSTFDVQKNSNENQNKEQHSNNQKLTETQIQLIERSILQQLFYSVAQSDIPLSRFKRITDSSKSNILLLCCLFVFVLSYLLVFKHLDSLIKIFIPLNEFPKIITQISVGALVISFIILVHKLLKYALNLKDVKFKLHDAEFNIQNEENKSILNDHLDEIIYFFESTQKNIVIIEDLDRFNNTEIFIRLRELNFLINQSCSHDVRFIYAIRDDMFHDSQRSKFFEYIIPVIPIINPTNAYDLIASDANYKKITEHLEDKFLRNICLYFDDMRLLLNILTEYKSYSEHLDFENLDAHKLFAIIVYKNYYPNEFAKLNSLKGEIYDLFNNQKSNLIADEKNKFLNKIEELKQKIQSIESESLNSVDELNQIYALHIMNYCIKNANGYVSTHFNFQVGEDTFSFDTLSDNLEKIVNADTFRALVGQWKNFKFSDIEEQFNNKLSYKARLALIKNKQNKEILTLNEEISELELQINQLDNLLLKDIITNDSLKNIENTSDLLWFCIKNGYVDETYQDYISYFFESSITRDDKNFARIVGSQNNPDFEIQLNKISDLLNYYIDAEQIRSDSSLNYSLVDYLLTNNDFKEHKNYLFKHLISNTKFTRDFINQYFIRNKNLGLFIPKLAELKSDCFEFLNNNEENIAHLIRYMPLLTLDKATSTKDNLEYFLDNRVDYISFVLDCFKDTNDPELCYKEFTKVLRPKLSLLEIDKSNSQHLELFNWLGKNDYLCTSYDVIYKIVYYNSDKTEEETTTALSEKPLTTIMNSDVEYLKNVIQNIDEHIDKILQANSNNNFKEDENILIEFLNGSIHKNLKIQLIQKSDTIIDDITKIKESDLHETIFNNHKIKPVWHNVMQIYQNHENELPEFLIEYINLSFKELIKDKDFHKKENNKSNYEQQKYFEVSIIKENSITDEAYEEIIQGLALYWNNIGIDSISANKTHSLIHYKKLTFSKENWSNIKSLENSDLTKKFIEVYLSNFLSEKEPEINLEPFDYVIILNCQSLKSERQTFAENNCANFIQSSESLVDSIIKLFDDKKIPQNLYSEILLYGTSQQLMQLITNQINYLNNQEIFECLGKMGEPFNQLAVIQDDEIRFENNKQNQDFLQLLYDKALIKKVELKKEKRLSNKKYLFSRRRKDV